MRGGQKQPSFGFLFLVFFSVRTTTLNFSDFCFYCLRRFLINFVAPFSRRLFQTAWKKCKIKKGQESQDLQKCKSDKFWRQQKRANQVANFFCWKVLYYNDLLVCKVTSQQHLCIRRSLWRGVIFESFLYLICMIFVSKMLNTSFNVLDTFIHT